MEKGRHGWMVVIFSLIIIPVSQSFRIEDGQNDLQNVQNTSQGFTFDDFQRLIPKFSETFNISEFPK